MYPVWLSILRPDKPADIALNEVTNDQLSLKLDMTLPEVNSLYTPGDLGCLIVWDRPVVHTRSVCCPTQVRRAFWEHQPSLCALRRWKKTQHRLQSCTLKLQYVTFGL